jgi:SAM-dependent methyltransferase
MERSARVGLDVLASHRQRRRCLIGARSSPLADASAERLPFEDGQFDLALAQLVVNFMTDPLAGVREMARVTRPHGTVGAAVWDYAGQMTLLRVLLGRGRCAGPGRERPRRGQLHAVLHAP